MQIHNWPFLLLCSLAGLLLLVGSLVLLWYRVISFDTEGKNPSVLEVLGKLKFSTHYPALLLFAVGGLLLSYPVYSSATSCNNPAFHNETPLRMVKLKGKIIKEGGTDVKVYVVVDEQEAEAGDDIKLEVPYLVGNHRYLVKYVDVATGIEVGKEEFRLEKNDQERSLKGIRAVAPSTARAVAVVRPQAEQKQLEDEFNTGGVQP